MIEECTRIRDTYRASPQIEPRGQSARQDRPTSTPVGSNARDDRQCRRRGDGCGDTPDSPVRAAGRADGDGLDLLFLKHVEEPRQLIPLALIGVALAATIWHVLQRGPEASACCRSRWCSSSRRPARDLPALRRERRVPARSRTVARRHGSLLESDDRKNATGTRARIDGTTGSDWSGVHVSASGIVASLRGTTRLRGACEMTYGERWVRAALVAVAIALPP